MNFDWHHALLSVFAALVTAVSAVLIRGSLRKKRWIIWPALVLFLLFFPIISVELFDSFINPPFPRGGFATEGNSIEQNHILWKQPTEAEFWEKEHRRRIMLVGWLLLTILPIGSTKYLRHKGALT
ncbi:hypothetical protein RA25_16900 [Leisingera sp. ANG-S5]|nr:hypothetical protein RA25_16900 [Leisingera sp. ANG-S5]